MHFFTMNTGLLDKEYSQLLRSLHQEPNDRDQNLARLKLLTDSYAGMVQGKLNTHLFVAFSFSFLFICSVN